MRFTILILFSIGWFSLQSQTVDTNYEENKKRAIKIEFFSPLTGNTTFGYESYIKDWISWEAKIGIIGLGVDSEETNPSGFFFKGGVKFKLNPDFVTDDLKGSHLLSGKYIRPEIVFARYREENNFSNIFSYRIRDVKETFTSFTFLITYGRQFILANTITLDYHFGLGYGYNSSESGRYNFSHINGDNSFPIAISVGFTIGVLLK